MSIAPELLSVIVPAHNEQSRIEATLRDVRDALPGSEIIVVVNDSSDRTLSIVQELAIADGGLALIDVPARVGKGGAVRIGFGLATRPYVAFIDADGSTSGAELRRLLDLLADCDCVVASRWLPKSQIDVRQSAARRVLGRGFNAFVRLLFGMRFWDTQCGAKLFRRVELLEVLDEVETADFAFDVDLLYAIHRRGHRIREVPTVWRDRAGSTVDVRSAVPRMFLSLVRLRLRHSLLRIALPLFDRYFRLQPIRSRRSLRYLVLAPTDGRAPASSAIEASVRRTLDAIESPAREITWFAVDARQWPIPAAGWLRAMVAYLRFFRDRFDCVIEVLPGEATFLTPLYCLKPKVVVQPAGTRLPLLYSSALVMESENPERHELEAALLLAMTRAGTHVYVDREGQLMLTEKLSRETIRELLIATAKAHA